MNEMISHWSLRYLNQAKFIAQWSKDPSTKVGCVISKNDIVIGQGFNGFPKMVKDTPERLNDKNLKRLMMVHAELNAIHFSTGSLENSTFHVTHRPCAACAGNIIQHRPLKIIIDDTSKSLSSDWQTSIEVGEMMFKEAGIPYICVDPETVKVWRHTNA